MEILLQITLTVIPFLIGGIVYIYKAHVNRIIKLEDKSVEFVTKQEVTTMINEKLEPIRDDINEIKQTLTKLYDFLLRKNV